MRHRIGSNEPDIHLPRVQQIQHLGWRHLVNVELDFGKLGAEALDSERHDFADDRIQPSKPDNAACSRREFLKRALRLVHLVQDDLGAPQEIPARVRQLHLIKPAVEQLGPDFLFQLRQLLRQCRLGEPELLGRLGEGCRLGNRAEDAQLMQVHAGRFPL